jgi:hypothetical protein
MEISNYSTLTSTGFIIINMVEQLRKTPGIYAIYMDNYFLPFHYSKNFVSVAKELVKLHNCEGLGRCAEPVAI